MVPHKFLKCLYCICEICHWYLDRDCTETWFLILKTYCKLCAGITQWTKLVTLPSCSWHSSREGRSKPSTSTEMSHKHCGDHSLYTARGRKNQRGLGCPSARGHKWGSERMTIWGKALGVFKEERKDQCDLRSVSKRKGRTWWDQGKQWDQSHPGL